MEIFGFICIVAILLFVNLGWGFVLFLDGALGSREVPLWVMGILFIVLACLWSLVINNAPFSIVIG